MIRCLVLSRYGLLGASSRVRFYEYFAGLKQHGIECELSPLLDDQYLVARYAGRNSRYLHAAKGYLGRIGALLAAGKYDVVWLEKELFPWLPSVFERFIAGRGLPYVVDYDDATFHSYDTLTRGALSPLYRRKFDTLLQGAHAVTAGNAYLEQLARKHGARRVVHVPSAVDLERYARDAVPVAETGADEVVVGWVGTPVTTPYLRIVEPPMAELAKTRRIRLMTIGAAPLDATSGVPLAQHPWSLDTEVDLIRRMDIGIMPLHDTPWERGKCGYKLIQYMAAGKPVIASPVGVNQDIVTSGVNGFLAADAEAWRQALVTLVDSTTLRRTMGEAGRTRVEERYSVQALLPTVAQVLKDAAEGRERL